MGRPRMIRRDGWEMRLRDLVKAARYKPFEWGAHDCCTFALDDFEAMIGRRVETTVRWSNIREAAALLQAASVADYADRWFGPAVEGWKTARRGDVVAIDAKRSPELKSPMLAVVVGAQVACPGEFGIEFARLDAAYFTWRVG